MTYKKAGAGRDAHTRKNMKNKKNGGNILTVWRGNAPVGQWTKQAPIKIKTVKLISVKVKILAIKRCYPREVPTRTGIG